MNGIVILATLTLESFLKFLGEKMTENKEDEFEEFFNAVREIMFKKAQIKELELPWLFVLNEETNGVEFDLPKPLWRLFVNFVVQIKKADAYITATEAWLTTDTEIYKKGKRPADDPNRLQLLLVSGYHKDGREKTDYVFVSEDRKLIRDPEGQPPIVKDMLEHKSEAHVENMVIGNIYYPERQEKAEAAILRQKAKWDKKDEEEDIPID
jgi:hypothetical protein